MGADAAGDCGGARGDALNGWRDDEDKRKGSEVVMTTLKDVQRWQAKPMGDRGWYWMRYKFKRDRRWSYEMVWVSPSVVDKVIIKGSWIQIAWVNKASFLGPIKPPVDAPG
jgi:hypothetical protein